MHAVQKCKFCYNIRIEKAIMKDDDKKEIHRFRRFRGYDYSRGAALFITIVTNPRRRLFGEIVEAKLRKTQLGEDVEKALLHEAGQTRGVRLYEHVVMPDHVHFRVYLEKGLVEPLKVLGGFVRRFKTWTTRCWKLQAGLATLDENGREKLQSGFETLDGGGRLDDRAPLGGLWQQGYHDWICQSKEMIAAVNRYIDYNPLKFELRCNQPEFLAIHEPLAAWRLSPDEFWRGIGAVGLLDCDAPFIALRISRKLSARQVAEAVERIRRRAGDYVFIGGWISPGEKAVRDMLLAEPRGRIVQILPSAMPHDYKVGSQWLEAIREKRAAIIARGNSEIEFSRAACLEVNEAARKIATASGGIRTEPMTERNASGGIKTAPATEQSAGVAPAAAAMGRACGKAVYWLPEGPKVIS